MLHVPDVGSVTTTITLHIHRQFNVTANRQAALVGCAQSAIGRTPERRNPAPLSRAEVAAKAVHYCSEAGAQAVRNHANPEAVRFLSEALRFAEKSDAASVSAP